MEPSVGTALSIRIQSAIVPIISRASPVANEDYNVHHQHFHLRQMNIITYLSTTQLSVMLRLCLTNQTAFEAFTTNSASLPTLGYSGIHLESLKNQHHSQQGTNFVPECISLTEKKMQCRTFSWREFMSLLRALTARVLFISTKSKIISSSTTARRITCIFHNWTTGKDPTWGLKLK